MEKAKYEIILHVDDPYLSPQEGHYSSNYYVEGTFNQAKNFAKKKAIELIENTTCSLSEVYPQEDGLYLSESMSYCVVSFDIIEEHTKEYEDISNEKDEEIEFEDMLDEAFEGIEIG